MREETETEREKHTSEESISGNSISGNSISGNSISGNSISGNSTSRNSTSKNSTSGNRMSGNGMPGKGMSGKRTSALAWRVCFYAMGLLILAFGLTLNTKTGLGVSPMLSLSYAASVLWNKNFGNVTMVLYLLFVLLEIMLHLGEQRRYGTTALGNLRLSLMTDALQLPLSMVFTRFLNLFTILIPDFAAGYGGAFLGSFAGRILVLLVAVACTGIGAALALDMRVVPNPGDGLVQAVSDFLRREVGLVKNGVDLTCILLTACMSLIAGGRIVGVGVGTLLAVLLVGRVIAGFNALFLTRITKMAGVRAKT